MATKVLSMNIKKGTKVRIKTQEEFKNDDSCRYCNLADGWCCIHPNYRAYIIGDMCRFAGRIVTISKSSVDWGDYEIIEDGGRFFWHLWMFSEIVCK